MADSAQVRQLLELLNSQKLMVMASISEDGEPWVCNIYYGADEDYNVYFVSSEDIDHRAKRINFNNEALFTISPPDRGADILNSPDAIGYGLVRRLLDDMGVSKALRYNNEAFGGEPRIVTITKVQDQDLDGYWYKAVHEYAKFWQEYEKAQAQTKLNNSPEFTADEDK